MSPVSTVFHPKMESVALGSRAPVRGHLFAAHVRTATIEDHNGGLRGKNLSGAPQPWSQQLQPTPRSSDVFSLSAQIMISGFVFGLCGRTNDGEQILEGMLK